MRQIISLFLIFLSVSTISTAQILKGKITNQSGDPIPYSTVYIQELRQGTTSNTKGDYEIRIPAGKYMVTYQSLGFSPVFENIKTTDQNTIIKNVVLPVQYYQIPEVRITASGEDPAYIVMRKVIGLAPYYLNNVSYYKAEVYLKGNLVINRIPKLLAKSMKMESNNHGTSVSAGGKPKNEEKVLKAGDSFLMESFNEIEFTAPDKYFQKVVSYNSTFPEQGNGISPMSFIQASFYQPVLADIAVSPLSPQAFSYYNFKYLGTSLQGNYTISKIQVIPKRKSQQVFEGTIYIIDDLWCLHSVDLTNENLAGKIKIQQLYVPVQDDVWLPVSHKFEINISIVGFKADAGYGASVKYLEVRPNLALQRPKSISADYGSKQATAVNKPDTVVTKTKKQIDKILEKNELSNRDMVKLASLMEKESEKSNNDSSKKNLEIKDRTTHVIEKDATKKDSAYWAEIRPVPLSDIELKTLRISDSTKAVLAQKQVTNDTIASQGKKVKNKFTESLKQIGFGHTWSDTIGTSFTFGGLIDLKKLSFNTVDGFVYGTDFRFSKRWKNGNTFYIYPDLRWAFSRESFMWRVSGSYNFSKLNPVQISYSAGITSRDIGTGGSINPLINSVTSLFFKNNYPKLYESRYLSLGYLKEVTNGLRLNFNVRFEDRRVLTNTTDFAFIKSARAYTDNIPVNKYLYALSNPINQLSDQRHGDFVTYVTYVPRQKYTIRNGRKIPRGSDWPTFNFTWKHGINEISGVTDSYKHYDMIKFEAFKQKDLGAFSEYRWRIRTGGFLNNKDVPFYDFFHFNAQPVPIHLDDYQDAFMIPSFYSLSTPEAFGEVHLKYTTPYLLLKLLPVLSNTLMRENLSFSYLGSRFHKNYTELGYSISEIFFLGELGVYVGFDDIKYRGAGVRVVLKFN